MKVKSLSHVGLFATPWTAACQAPPSMGVSRQEYWSGLPLPSPKSSTALYKSAIHGFPVLNNAIFPHQDGRIRNITIILVHVSPLFLITTSSYSPQPRSVPRPSSVTYFPARFHHSLIHTAFPLRFCEIHCLSVDLCFHPSLPQHL